MGGMGGPHNDNNPLVVSAFHQALLRGGFVVLALMTALFLVWRFCRAAQLRRGMSGADGPGAPETAVQGSEPAGRRFLRVTFGLLWVFDGLLQGQASMPLGMIPQVVQPSASSSPSWVQHLVNSASTVWTYHPATAAAAAVWIQVGVGLMLLVGGRAEWSRLAGVASAAWGLVVWIFGEAFGSLFGTGLTWMFGAPGAALLYVAAGVLVALPLTAWSSPALGRWALRVLGTFFVGMALLQAWPGRGFWQGQAPGAPNPGTLTGMVQDMAGTPQPHLLSSLVSAFAGFDADHGWGVNLFVVAALALIGVGLLQGRAPIARIAVLGAAVLSLADWVFVEDLGFMGGTGTDPNNMIPILLVVAGGYLALTRLPAPVPVEEPPPVTVLSWRQQLVAEPASVLRLSALLAAAGITLVGAVPMAVAATEPHAGTTPANAIAGPAHQVGRPAAP